MYKDYLENMQKRFLAEFEGIEVGHNFDYGTEFEISLCHVLKTVLPSRFGISRGYAVNAEGKFFGDDILIHDPMTHPRLSVRNVQTFARKEKIPIEGVYSYIEAKHTVRLDGDGDQSLKKARKQVSDVKELVASREKRELNEAVDGVTFSGNFVVPNDNWDIWNPPHGTVFARKVKLGNDLLSGEQIFEELKGTTTR